MSGLTTDTYREVRAALLDCGEISDDREVRAVFGEPRLRPWRNRIPQASSISGRVDTLIDFLHNKGNTSGQNALALFLQVLSEKMEGSACETTLAAAAAAVARETGSEPVGDNPVPQPGTTEHSGTPENWRGGPSYTFHGPVTIQSQERITMGDSLELSGDFRGSILNIKSRLDNVSQQIDTIPRAGEETKDELRELINKLEAVLKETPRERAEDAEVVSKRLQDLVDEAQEEEPESAILQVSSERLRKAAHNISDILPDVFPIATQIVSLVVALAG